MLARNLVFRVHRTEPHQSLCKDQGCPWICHREDFQSEKHVMSQGPQDEKLQSVSLDPLPKPQHRESGRDYEYFRVFSRREGQRLEQISARSQAFLDLRPLGTSRKAYHCFLSFSGSARPELINVSTGIKAISGSTTSWSAQDASPKCPSSCGRCSPD